MRKQHNFYCKKLKLNLGSAYPIAGGWFWRRHSKAENLLPVGLKANGGWEFLKDLRFRLKEGGFEVLSKTEK